MPRDHEKVDSVEKAVTLGVQAEMGARLKLSRKGEAPEVKQMTKKEKPRQEKGKWSRN